MNTLNQKKTPFKLLSMLLIAMLIFGFMSPPSAMAAKTQKIKPKGLYWDYKVKTANSKSVKVVAGKKYKVVLKGQNQNPNYQGGYNGIVRFQLPKYGTYKIEFSNLKGNAGYVDYVLYKKYNSGIGKASFLYNSRPALCSQEYYNKVAANAAAGNDSANELNTLKVGKATAKAILESEKIHYIYFMTDGTATFNFKISKTK